MIAFDSVYEVTLGISCAAATRDTRFRDGLLASSLVFIPICSASITAWPGWQSMYLVDLDRGGSSLAIAAALQAWWLAMCYLAGFAFGDSSYARANRKRTRVIAVVTWALVIGVLFGPLWHRALFVTTYADFHDRPIFRVDFGSPDSFFQAPLIAFLVGSGIANGIVSFLLWRAERKLKARHAGPERM